MIKFYYTLGPNPMKVALCLEEMGLAYEPIPIDLRRGEQHEAWYRAINPNGKVPAIVDGPTIVFDSNAILLYLADKTGLCLPEPALHGEMLSWLMFIASGVGPYSGQSAHFKAHAPPPQDYAIARYDFEARRHWGIINDRLADRPFMVGDSFTIVDMAFWGWARVIPHLMGPKALARMPNVARHLEAINERPAGQRALAIKDRHAFKTGDYDAAERVAMFPHLATLT